jgi:phytoene dehydrogenase-like protein
VSASADFVVAGAGHNSLITAAYLARAGYEVLVLDARPIPGGGAASEEMLGPGYLIDSCSTGHTLIQTNPLLVDDELGLRSRYGLDYIEPDPYSHVVFPDGEQLTMWLDLDRSCAELARFSERDAEAYRRMIGEYDAVKHLFGRSRFTPPGFGPSLDEMLAEDPDGRRWRRRRLMSAWDVVRHEFETPHVRAFMLWQAFQTLVPVDGAGSGPLAYSIAFGRQRRGWTIPAGGSGQLTEALVRSIADDGGTVLCDRVVSRLVLEGGRCTGVETEDGERYTAREAVVSTIHVKHLVEMAPPESWGADFLYGVETYDVGLSGFAVYLATTSAPEFETADGPRSSVSGGLVGWPEDIVAHCRRLRDGVYDPDPQWLLVATPTLVDPSRAPAGHHTVKFLSGQGWRLPEGESSWDELKLRQAERQLERVRAVTRGLEPEAVLETLVKSPFDIERSNRHMIRGAFHGGDRGLAQSGALRPVPGWGQHRMPIEGLYQTGGTTHPGGSITGAPGRNAAWVILADRGRTLAEAVGGELSEEVGTPSTR